MRHLEVSAMIAEKQRPLGKDATDTVGVALGTV